MNRGCNIRTSGGPLDDAGRRGRRVLRFAACDLSLSTPHSLTYYHTGPSPQRFVTASPYIHRTRPAGHDTPFHARGLTSPTPCALYITVTSPRPLVTYRSALRAPLPCATHDNFAVTTSKYEIALCHTTLPHTRAPATHTSWPRAKISRTTSSSKMS
jgi:hypothetical protein